jgi:hypothetical protein
MHQVRRLMILFGSADGIAGQKKPQQDALMGRKGGSV